MPGVSRTHNNTRPRNHVLRPAVGGPSGSSIAACLRYGKKFGALGTVEKRVHLAEHIQRTRNVQRLDSLIDNARDSLYQHLLLPLQFGAQESLVAGARITDSCDCLREPFASRA